MDLKLISALLIGIASAQQCIEPQHLAPVDAAAVAAINGSDVHTDEPEKEYFEKVGEGWTSGNTKGGKRTGTWWFYQDKNNWKKVTYKNGDVIFWQRLVAGRRLFEQTYNFELFDWHVFNIKVYELEIQADRTLEWVWVDDINNPTYVNEHGHFNNQDGTPSARRSQFGSKYGYGDEFDETLLGTPLK